MTPPENDAPLWNDAQVESVLVEFFREEIPPELRQESPEPPITAWESRSTTATPVREQPPQTSRATSPAGTMMVLCSSVLIAMLAVKFWSPSTTSEADSQADSQENSSQPLPRAHRKPDPYSEILNPQGPVESRPRTAPVRQGDPDENRFPELDIEVFPLDGKPSKSDANRSLPEDGLPESEERTLPESRPDPLDPDEPDDLPMLPMLPELQTQPNGGGTI